MVRPWWFAAIFGNSLRIELFIRTEALLRGMADELHDNL